MPKNKHNDERYRLDCYPSFPAADEEPHLTEYSDNEAALEERAEILNAAGRFQSFEVKRFDAEKDDWEVLSSTDFLPKL